MSELSDTLASSSDAEPRFNPRQYWERRLIENQGILGVGYTALGRRYNEWKYRLRWSVVLRELRKLGLNWPSTRVLDIGSGTGFYIGLWKELGVKSLTGFDITEIAVARLQQQFPDCDFHQVDITSLPFPISGNYDFISAFDVLFHLIDDTGYKQAIENIYAALSPGGLFIFSEMFVHGRKTTATHQVSRSITEIESVLTNAGFHIVRRTPMFVTMNIPVDTSNRVATLWWRVFSKVVHNSETVGFLSGAVLFAVDWLLTRLLRESPTTEMMICRK